MDKIKELRKYMQEKGLSALLIPRTDQFQGEFISPSSDRLRWLTGFTGSSGFAVISKNKAAFFTDSRYTLQARNEVPDAYEHFDIFQKHPYVWISENLKSGEKVGYDPWLFTENQLRPYDKPLIPLDKNLVDEVWKDRPRESYNFIFIHPLEFAGESGTSKREKISSQLKADQVLITASDSISWLLNIRGKDVEYVPLVQGYCLLRRDGTYDLFVHLDKIDGEIFSYIQAGNGRIIDINQIQTHLKMIQGSCQIDPQTCPIILIQTLESGGINLVKERDPCVLPKALKNEVEIQGAIHAQVQDGLALVRFFAWLEAQPLKGETTEYTAAEKVTEFRKLGEHFKEISFFAISAFGPHGAIIHYKPTLESSIPIMKNGIYLLDSGGQYLTGTTDITRTIVVGQSTPEQRDKFTRVLKGHIALAMAVFPQGTSGHELDVLAREPLWEVGCDYGHGTGHGVGSYLNVHEGPQGISRKAPPFPLMPGMIISNEPGYYKEGEYGIRIESEIRVVEVPGLEGYYGFDTITFVPIDLNLIDVSLMTGPEKLWLNEYHANVFKMLSPHLDPETKEWLEKATRGV